MHNHNPYCIHGGCLFQVAPDVVDPDRLEVRHRNCEQKDLNTSPNPDPRANPNPDRCRSDTPCTLNITLTLTETLTLTPNTIITSH